MFKEPGGGMKKGKEIPIIVCLVCEKRGPKFITFRIDELEPGYTKLTAECACKNSEVCFERKSQDEIERMAASGGFDFRTMERFTQQ